jgi:hypothetical protein
MSPQASAYRTKHQQAEALRMLAEEDDQGQPKYTQAAVARFLMDGARSVVGERWTHQ